MSGAVDPQYIARGTLCCIGLWRLTRLFDAIFHLHPALKGPMISNTSIEVLQMKKIALFFALLTTVAFSPLSVNAQAFGEYSGEETFLRFCAACHGEKGHGDGPVASGLPITVPDLTLIRRRQGDKFPEETLRKIIDGRNVVVYHGTRYMPVWGYEFWVEEGADDEARERVEVIIANLIDYITSIQR
jgi:hypothetical protein